MCQRLRRPLIERLRFRGSGWMVHRSFNTSSREDWFEENRLEFVAAFLQTWRRSPIMLFKERNIYCLKFNT
ncbi:hypothetical protein Leryth_024683 [Lithospermum erythrorhizon]|nr:hypothetical protein Leryth_024683 [Lithospermum erythrorhizon]